MERSERNLCVSIAKVTTGPVIVHSHGKAMLLLLPSQATVLEVSAKESGEAKARERARAKEMEKAKRKATVRAKVLTKEKEKARGEEYPGNRGALLARRKLLVSTGPIPAPVSSLTGVSTSM